MKGPWTTAKDFKNFKNFPPWYKMFSKHTKGWAAEKHAILSQASIEATKNLVRDKSQDIELMRLRQAEKSRKMQDKGENALNLLEPKNTEDARKLLVSGLEQERAAFGVNERGGGSSNLTQVNVNVPKTRFDEFFDAEDVTGILQLIADVKRERTRRAGTSLITEGQTEAHAG